MAARSIAIRAGALSALAVLVLLMWLAPRAAAEEGVAVEAVSGAGETVSAATAEAPVEATPPVSAEVPAAAPAEATSPSPVEVTAEASAAAPAEAAPEVPTSAPTSTPTPKPVTEVATDADAEATTEVEATVDSAAAAPAETADAAATNVGGRGGSGDPVDEAVTSATATATEAATSAGHSIDRVAKSTATELPPVDRPVRAQTETVVDAIGSVNDPVGPAGSIPDPLAPIAGPVGRPALPGAAEEQLRKVGGGISKVTPPPIAGIPVPTGALRPVAPRTPTATPIDPSDSIAPSAGSTDIPRPTLGGSSTTIAPVGLQGTTSGSSGPTSGDPRPALAAPLPEPGATPPLAVADRGGASTATAMTSVAMTATAMSATTIPASRVDPTRLGAAAPDRRNAPMPPAPTPPGSPSTVAPSGSGSGPDLFIPLSALAVLVALSAPAGLRRSRELPARLAATPFVCALERPG